MSVEDQEHLFCCSNESHDDGVAPHSPSKPEYGFQLGRGEKKLGGGEASIC